MQIDKTINRILYVPFNEDYSVDKKVGNVNLDFLAAIDTNTIFGNLIDNAIEPGFSDLRDEVPINA